MDIYIIDEKGALIAHVDPSLVLKGTKIALPEKDGIYKGMSGSKVIMTSKKFFIGSHHYYLIMEIPFFKAMSLTMNSLISLATVIILTILVSLVIALLVSHGVIKPLDLLADKANKITEGDLNPNIEIKRADEFGILANALNIMTTKLHETINSLEHQIIIQKETETALKRAKEDAEIANKSKSAFLANMSHELRTPLNAILGFSQLLERDSMMNSTHKETLGIIRKSGVHLLNLINDILEISKIESGRLVLDTENIDIFLFIKDIQEMMKSKADTKGIIFNVSIEPNVQRFIKTDANKLRQILINLTNNAIKFTKQGSVTLNVKCDECHSEEFYLYFEVQDTGVGISEEEIHNLFNLFSQTQSGKDLKEGTGLGLSISQKLIKFLGGEIHVKSKLNHGSLFKFYITAQKGIKSEVKMEKTLERVIGLKQNQPEYTILIVEDNEYSLKLLSTLLKSCGFKVIEARNGLEGVKQFKNKLPDFIWMDLKMPVMDGYESTKIIRKSEHGQKVPIIALTASAFEEQRSIILDAGCNEFIRKPFVENQIFETMAKYLGVKYIYENRQPKINADNKSLNNISDFSNIPHELFLKLEKAIISLDMDNISSVIKEIHGKNSNVGDKIEEMANTFDYNRILDLIKKMDILHIA
ncbi:MAG: response regulator [Desulfobacterales bacterium]|nr:response regulator [Desulfobacterales bacterium]